MNGSSSPASSLNPVILVRQAGVERYRFDLAGTLDNDEAMRCVACGFSSRLPKTPVFAWVRIDRRLEPPVMELCEICHAAAGGPPFANRFG